MVVEVCNGGLGPGVGYATEVPDDVRDLAVLTDEVIRKFAERVRSEVAENVIPSMTHRGAIRTLTGMLKHHLERTLMENIAEALTEVAAAGGVH